MLNWSVLTCWRSLTAIAIPYIIDVQFYNTLFDELSGKKKCYNFIYLDVSLAIAFFIFQVELAALLHDIGNPLVNSQQSG